MDRPQDWVEVKGALQRELRFRNFAEALEFVNRLGAAAEQANHHPDVCIHDWNRVTVRWWTHVTGTITQRDVDMARRTNELVSPPA